MKGEGSILQSVREYVVGTSDNEEFDKELISHINSALGKLNQAGIGKFLVLEDEEQTWDDLIDPEQEEGNKFFKLVPQFINLDTQLLFDPPPPSNVEYHSNSSKELLWRLKIAYETGGEDKDGKEDYYRGHTPTPWG